MLFKRLFFVIIIFISCKEEVTILSSNNKNYNWKGGNGFLIVKKGKKCDTIYDCSYGRTPYYKLITDNRKKYLFTSCEINGGGNNVKNYFLWSLDENSFLDTIYYKEIFVSEEYKINDSLFTYIKREPTLSIENNMIKMDIDSTVEKFNNFTGKFKLISKGNKSYIKKIIL